MGLSNSYIINILTKSVENEKTRHTYISRLQSLSTALHKTMYDILKDPTLSYPQIQTAYEAESTRKSIVTVILAVYKHIDDLHIKKKKAHQQWKDIHEELRELETQHYKKNKPTDKQLDNYLSFQEIEDKYNALSKDNPHKTKKSSLEYLLLSITIHIRPKRADFGNVYICQSPNIKSPSKNYILMNKSNNSYLFLAEYKTAKTYDTIKEIIPELLYKDITESIKKHPRNYLFVDKSNKSYKKNESYSAYVIRVFESLFNRRVGVTMLRHIYVREKLDFNGMTQEELDKEATLMGHSAEVQRMYRWVIRDNEMEKCECKVKTI